MCLLNVISQCLVCPWCKDVIAYSRFCVWIDERTEDWSAIHTLRATDVLDKACFHRSPFWVLIRNPKHRQNFNSSVTNSFWAGASTAPTWSSDNRSTGAATIEQRQRSSPTIPQELKQSRKRNNDQVLCSLLLVWYCHFYMCYSIWLYTYWMVVYNQQSAITAKQLYANEKVCFHHTR